MITPVPIFAFVWIPFLVALLITTAVSLTIAVLHALIAGPKPVMGQQLKNKTVSTSVYGQPWPRCRGSVRLSGNMIWSSAINETIHKSTSGGIFGIGQQAVYTYSYSVNVAVAFGYRLGLGAANKIWRIYADGKFLYNARTGGSYLTGQVLRGPAMAGAENVFIISNTGSSSFHIEIGDQLVFPETPSQIYIATTTLTLGPNSSGALGIYPPAVQDYPITSVVTLLGLTSSPVEGDTDADDYTGTIYDNSSFDPDPSDGSHLSGGYIPHQGGIRFYLGTADQTPDPLITSKVGAVNSPGYRNMVYAVIYDLELANYGNRIPNISAEIDFDASSTFTVALSTVGTLALSDVVAGHMTEAGYAANQYDVTALANTFMVGYEVDQEDYQASIRRLMGLYLFDSAEIDGVITFKFHDGNPVLSIPFDDLGALADHTQQEPRLEETLTDEQDIPETVWVRYYEPDKEFQQCSQYDKRISQPYASDQLTKLPVTNSRKSLTIDIPITNTAPAMRQQAQKILYDLWSSRSTVKFKLPQKYIQLDPTDIIEIPYYDDFVLVRLSQVDRGAAWPLQLEGVSHDYHHSVATSHGGGGSGGPVPPPSTPPACVLELLDIPFIEDADTGDPTNTSIYFAVGSTLNVTPAVDQTQAQFHGAKVYRSTDDVKFDVIGSVDTAAWMGTAVNILPLPTNPWVFDDTNVLHVAPLANVAGTPPATLTDDEVTSGHGNLAALIHHDGTLELLQFGHASLNGDGSYSLSHLVRGVRGTETMTTGMAIGDLFVLLTNNTGHATIPFGDHGVMRYYTAISDGNAANFTTPAPIQEQVVPRDLMPYAPWHIGGYIDAFSNIIISWDRRTRYGAPAANWASGKNGPLSEAFEEYEIDIKDPSGFFTLRTIKSNVPTALYSRVMQTADFGGIVNQVRVSIYQISATIGRGFPGRGLAPNSAPAPKFGDDPYVITWDLGPLNTPNPGDLIIAHRIASFVAGVFIPVGWDGSTIGCRIAPSGTYVISIFWTPGDSSSPAQHIADAIINGGQLQGTFAFLGFTSANSFTLQPGDLVEFFAPAGADATISGIYCTASSRRLNTQPATTGNTGL